MIQKMLCLVILFPSAFFPQTAQDLVSQVLRTYASCESYEDEGQATTTFFFNGSRVQVLPFSTVFIRQGSRFRYEYKQLIHDEWSRYLIWMDGNDISTWWTVRPLVVHPPSLEEALSAATGVSATSSIVVPSMLLPTLTPRHTFDNLEDFRLGKSVQIDGVTTIPISGMLVDGHVQFTYWVGEKDHLIRKVEWTNVSNPDYRVQHILTYSPKLNSEIQPSKFAFDPPR
jgi:outer membrane lipoprotein-sorting protein